MSEKPIKGKPLEEVMAEWKAQEEWDKAHPVLAFFRDIPDFFIYTIPRKFDDTYYSAKWGFQRMFREYDDPSVFDFHYHHARITLKQLKRLRESKHGSPMTKDPDNVLKTKWDPMRADDAYHEAWDEAMAVMIRGFEAILEADDVHILDESGKYDPVATSKKYEELFAEWEKGMKLFVANYRGLWD